MKYFSIRELSSSVTAVNHRIDNTPTKEAKERMVELIENLLDPIREKYGKPIIVTSGYRCPLLNTFVGGSVTSQHMTGCAVDIRSTTDSLKDNKELLDCIRKMNPDYDQLIWEYGTKEGPDWIHISYNKNRNRHEFLKIGIK